MNGGLGFNVIYHPLNFKGPQNVYEDENVVVTSFPLKHSIPTCGFLFREKQKLPHINKYHIPVKTIQSIKKGADYITETGEVLPHSLLTIPSKKTLSYAFCTDTAYHEPIINIIKEADLLYHESTFLNDKKGLAQQTLHSTAEQAATIAKKANVKKLLIGHFSNRYKTLELFLKEAREVFPETYLAEEGNIFKVNS